MKKKWEVWTHINAFTRPGKIRGFNTIVIVIDSLTESYSSKMLPMSLNSWSLDKLTESK